VAVFTGDLLLTTTPLNCKSEPTPGGVPAMDINDNGHSDKPGALSSFSRARSHSWKCESGLLVKKATRSSGYVPNADTSATNRISTQEKTESPPLKSSFEKYSNKTLQTL
jgi:hypothetical protein